MIDRAYNATACAVQANRDHWSETRRCAGWPVMSHKLRKDPTASARGDTLSSSDYWLAGIEVDKTLHVPSLGG